jgi:hypothetical protein
VYLDTNGVAAAFGSERLQRFGAVQRKQDPTGRFLNDFTRRVLAGEQTAKVVPVRS